MLSFGFVDKIKNVSFNIAIPENATKQETQAAENMVKYFKFCAQKKVVNPNSPAVKISKLNNVPATGNWLLIKGSGKGASVSLKDGRILK